MEQNKHESKPKWNSDNHIDHLITSYESEKALKLIKYGKSPGANKINSQLYKYEGAGIAQSV
jgi:hypothetical protein